MSDINDKVKSIEDAYLDVVKKLDVLAAQQSQIIKDFMDSLKNKRLEEIRGKIANL